MEQAVGGDAGSAVWAGVSVQIRERAAGLGHDEGGRGEVPQGHLGFGGDVYRAFGHEAVGPEITIAAQALGLVRQREEFIAQAAFGPSG